MMSHHLVERRLGKALGVSAHTGVRRSPSDPRDPGQGAGAQVADRLGDDHPLARRGQHPLEDPPGVGREVVEARLHDRDVRGGEGRVAGREVEPPGIEAAAP